MKARADQAAGNLGMGGDTDSLGPVEANRSPPEIHLPASVPTLEGGEGCDTPSESEGVL